MELVVERHEELRRKRRRARLTQIEVAVALNISDSALSAYEVKGDALPFDITPDELEQVIDDLAAQRGAA